MNGTGPNLRLLGIASVLSALSFRADLDAGWYGKAVLSEPTPGVRRGSRGQLLIGGQSIDVAVLEVRVPWRGGQGPRISFCDPVTFEQPFSSPAPAVFASPTNMTGFAQVVASRLAVLPPDEFLSKQYPHVIVDGLSLVETLRLMIRRFNVDWHWRWMRDTIEIGPLPQSGDLELETSGEFDVEGGFEADLHLNMPQLGDRVRAAGPAGTVREGNVTQIRVHFPDRPLAYHIRVAESPILLPMSQPSANSILHEGTLDQLDPLMVRVHLPSGDTCPVRGRLFALRLAACRVNVPLQAGDRVLVEWPLHALTTAPLRVFAEGETAPSTSLEIHAKELHVQPSKIKVLSDEVNIDELHP